MSNPNPNTINLVVELGPESQAKLDKILAALESIGRHDCASCVESAVHMTKDLSDQVTAAEDALKAAGITVPAEQPDEQPAPAADPAPAEEPEQPKYTKADVLALVQKLAAPNSPKREAAKAIVKSYGAKVSDIPADKYGEVMEKLNKLTQEG